MTLLLDTAKYYRDNGLSVFGASSKNKPGVEWGKFRYEFASDKELYDFFIAGGRQWMAIACGEASGHLEVIDLDLKNDPTGKVWPELWAMIMDYYKQNPPFPIVSTPSGGVHIYYRCPEKTEGNQHLAKFIGNPKAIIETRGPGGFIYAPPSPGYVSNDDRVPHKIPVISAEEREDIYEMCRSFNQVFKPERKVGAKSVGVYRHTPWGAYNESNHFESVLTDAGWTKIKEGELRDLWRRPGKDEGHSASWNHETRQFYVFSSSTEFEMQRGLRPFDIYLTLKCGGDIGLAVKEIKPHYGKEFTPTEKGCIADFVPIWDPEQWDKMMDMLDEKIVEIHGEVTEEIKKPLVETIVALHARSRGEFWEISNSGKITIKRTRFKKFLESKGYRKLAPDIKDPLYKFVKIEFEKHLITEMTLEMVKEDVGGWITDNCPENYDVNPEELSDAFISMSDTQLKGFLGHIRRIYMSDITFLRDTRTTGYFFFLNGVVRITKEEVEIIDYSDLPPNSLLWPGQIIQREIEIYDVATEEEANKSIALQFIKRISGVPKEIEHLSTGQLKVSHFDIYEKYAAFLTTIGYLVTNYKNRSKPFAIVLAENTSTSKEGGGSGKGALVQMIGLVRSVAEYDLSVWKIDKSFAFQRVTPSTGILFFDEAPRNFKISSLNAVITQGSTIERKNKDEFFIPFELSPKPVLATNFNISDEAKYEARRQRKILFSSYFHPDHTIEDEYGCEIFKGEWSDVQYKMTFNVLFRCLQAYLTIDIVKYPMTESFREKRFVEGQYGDTFEFLNTVVTDHLGKWISQDTYYQRFLDTGADKNYWKKRRFTTACQAFANEFGYDFERVQAKKADVRDEYFIIFMKQGAEKPELVINASNVPF